MLGHKVSVFMYIVKLQPLLLRKLFIKVSCAPQVFPIYRFNVNFYHAIGISLNNYANMLCDEHEGGA